MLFVIEFHNAAQFFPLPLYEYRLLSLQERPASFWQEESIIGESYLLYVENDVFTTISLQP